MDKGVIIWVGAFLFQVHNCSGTWESNHLAVKIVTRVLIY